MKKIIVGFGILILATLVACGGSVDTDALVDQAANAAKDGLDAAQGAVQEVADDAQNAIESAVADTPGDQLSIGDVIGSYTFHTPDNDWHYVEIIEDGDMLVWINRADASWTLTPDFENNLLLTDDSFPYQADFQNYEIVMENGNYKGLVSNGDLWVPSEEPAAEVAVVEEIVVEVTNGGIQGIVQDVISDSTLSGAQVCVAGHCATADGSGAYSLGDVSAGEQSVSISLDGYKTSEISVSFAAGETLSQNFALAADAIAEEISNDWIELKSDTLQDPVFLTGFILDDGTTTEREGQATLSDGDKIAYNNFPFLSNHPLIGITAGMEAEAIIIANSSVTIEHVFAQRAKSSETELGKAAFNNLNTLTSPSRLLTLKAVSPEMKPVKQGDLIEISLGTAGSSELPYNLKIYSGETNELLAEFEITQ